jgi:hypothetical protein
VVCAVTIVASIGGPLVGRGVFVGVNLIRYDQPWRADRPSDEVYRLPPLHDTVELGVPQRTLIRDTLFDEGRLPLWEPYANGGTPLATRPGSRAQQISDLGDYPACPRPRRVSIVSVRDPPTPGRRPLRARTGVARIAPRPAF